MTTIPSQLFVVERYDDTGTPGRVAPLPELPRGAHLVCAVSVPADDVVLALVVSEDEETLRSLLAAAGYRVDRITPATWAHPGASEPRTQGRPEGQPEGQP